MGHASQVRRQDRRPPDEPIDRVIARIATAQHGVVTRRQLAGAGIGLGAIDHRLACGRLHRVHRGVYLVGHPLPAAHALDLAAVLACGDGAVLSHESAAAAWSLLPPVEGPIDVTVVGRSWRRAGIRLHRTSALAARDVRIRAGVPITAPARTLLDVAEAVSLRRLERALDQAGVLGLVSHREVLALIERSPGRHGAAPLRGLIESERGPALTRSEAEEMLLALLRKAGLRAPRVNVRVGRHEVDFLWPAQRLIVEVDGYAYHSSRSAFERDRLRDAELQAAGYRVMRVTWRQLVDEREALIVRLARALGP